MPDPMNAARDQLARDAEAESPGWAIRHHLRGWTATRTRDSRTQTATSLPGLLALISVVETAGPPPAP
jgi:hypothetical protein